MNLAYLQAHITMLVIVIKIFIGGSVALMLLTAFGSFVWSRRNTRQGKMPFMALVVGAELVLVLFSYLSWVQNTLSVWMPPIPNSPYVTIAQTDAQAVGIDPKIYIRQINRESGFNPNARSAAGAEGIAQFMPDMAASLSLNPWDPAQSLQGAAQYMASLFHTYQDYAKALAVYNAGQGTVDQALSYGPDWLSHLPSETQNYVRIILAKG